MPEALRFIGLPGDAAGAKFRAWVKQSKNGCTNRKMNLTVEAGHTKTLTCCHVKKSVFSNDLLQKVQKAFDDLKRSETSSQGNQTLITKFSTVAGSDPQERGSGCSSDDKTSNTTMQRTMPVDHEVSVITCSELEVDQGTEGFCSNFRGI